MIRINIWKVNIALSDITKLKDIIEEQIKVNFSGEELIPILYFKQYFQEVNTENIQIIIVFATEQPGAGLTKQACLVPIVGDRKISIVKNDDFYDKIDVASDDLMDEYIDKVPLSFTCPGTVDKKDYIIATVNLPKGTPVYNLPVEYKNFPVLIDYGTMKASTNLKYHEYHEDLKPGISIGDSRIENTFTLGAFFTIAKHSDKKYLLTVNHGVGEVGNSIIQPSKEDNGDRSSRYCATVTKYKDLSIDESGHLLDFAFCEVEDCGVFTINKPCDSDISIMDIQSTLDHAVGSIIFVQKVDRTTGHKIGKMKIKMKRILVTETFEQETYVKMLVVTGYFSDLGDSGASVYNQDSLWEIYQSTSESGFSSGVIPIDLILERIYEKENERSLPK
ncbi:hypothetical protein C1645_835635 [Glomus cerebriforme]|uniref:Uncharacterized protein n=1 Tax=Glomus cerebriforme TaxID=658196 RepID=A0A397S7C1_9GLOM|nr:hypothetical protein C1645_835635 [Glomus cerebriforme]